MRLLGVGVSGLGEQPYQPQLWDLETDEYRSAEELIEKQERLRSVVESLSERYGEDAIRRGGEK